MADSNLNLVKIFEDVLKSERAIVVTLPSSEQWEDYQKEMDAVKDYSQVMNFKVPFFPKGINKGDKCYIVHDGKVKGWKKMDGKIYYAFRTFSPIRKRNTNERFSRF